MENGSKPRYRYRWGLGAWKLMNEDEVSGDWPYWCDPMCRYE